MKFVQTVLLSVVAMSLVRGQTATQVDLRTQAKSVDFSSAITTKPLKSGSILPATCSVGDMYYKTDAPAGGNVYGCVALNTWAMQSGGALGGDVSGPANAATVTQIQGRAIAATAPSGGQALTWNGSTSRWEPQTVSGGSGNATQLQGRNVATVTPSDTNVLCWSTTNSSWGPCASGGITNPFTFPGKFTAAASGVGAASFAIPAGVAPSTPSAGDVWNVAGALQFHNGSAAKTLAFVDSSITGTAAGITGKTAQGNGSLLLLGSGSYAAGNVTSIDANGNVVDGGLAVANIVRTGSTYADPAWISSLAPAKVGNGTAQWNANQINGTSLAGLGTGLLKNTTGTGVPSIAVAGDIPDLSATYIPVSTLTTSQDILYRNGAIVGRLPIVTSGKCLGNTGGVWTSLDCSGGGMTYPGAGFGVSTGSAWGTSRTIAPGTGITVTHGDGVAGNPTVAADTAVMLSKAVNASGTDLYVSDTSGNTTYAGCPATYTIAAYTNGMRINFRPNTSSTTTATLNLCTLGAKSIFQSDGTTDPATQLSANKFYTMTYDSTLATGAGAWRMTQGDSAVFGTNPTILQGSSLSAGTGGGAGIPGLSLTAGRVYYYGASGLALAKGDSSTTVPGVCIAISTTVCAYSGVYKFSATQSWTVGGILYISAASAGALTQTAPASTGNQVQRFGVAIAADTVLILPSLDVGGIQ